MTDLKNNLEEVWREDFENLFNEKYNKLLCGYTLKQWTTQERMDQEREFAFPYYVEARKKAQEEIEFWKNEYVSHSETMCKCQEELQKTRQKLEKAEKLTKQALSIQEDNYGDGSGTHVLLIDWAELARQYFEDKQGE